MNTDNDAMRHDIDAALRAGSALGDVKTTPGHEPVLVVPEGYRTEGLTPILAPVRKVARVRLHDLLSLLEYVERQGEADKSRTCVYIDADPTAPSITAVIDDHAGDEPGFREHFAVWKLIYSRQWSAWISAIAWRKVSARGCASAYTSKKSRCATR